MQNLRLPRLSLFISAGLLLTFIILLLTHAVSIENFLHLLKTARPAWLILAVVFQAVTYFSLAMIWYEVGRVNKFKFKIFSLTKLALEKFAVDQILHVGGIAGKVAAVKLMQKMNVPPSVAMEALLVDTLTYYAAYAVLAIAVLLLLALYYHSFFVLPLLLILFITAMVLIILGIWWLVKHRDWQPPEKINKYSIVRELREMIVDINPENMGSPKLLISVGLFQLSIFLLDALTLWAILLSLGVDVSLVLAFMGFVVPAIGALVTLLPGGIGGYEVSSTAVLALLGVPIEAAIAATILIRGFTLWIPLIPGSFMVHHDLFIKEEGEFANLEK
ncbi:flippase-like domain-containing protein [Candidatus Parcubacteria bacterium]|nr:flippase-like domain-containing protein [Candidatus Parcubacteria bacterium]